MTATFDHFLKQYNSTGSQKADGYNESHFDSLNDAEKAKAFDLLEQELIAPGVTEWLMYLDQTKAIDAFKQYISSATPGTSAGTHRVYNALYKATGDQEYLDKMIENYSHYLDWEREEALWLIRNNSPKPKAANTFYRNLLEAEYDPKVKSLAADFYLRNNGYTCNSKNESKAFFELKNKLTSLGIDDRDTLFSDLESFQA
ncbi:hypothetical protein [Ketobacter sp.]|uniref:hypothetical protein n=1 Tax=Ketobacter sp. TaxID=2083498 RepID=UPI000F140C27|nr:hypothetical protein [Ketobacter sp.]RLU00126.1 MAG: hypothetical protein D9N14_06435 [Ketobacter sp.]